MQQEQEDKNLSEKKVKRDLAIFSLSSFLNDLGAEMIYPIWPLFLTAVLGANMTILGLIDGISNSIVSISQAASGYLSDRIKKRKIFIWTGYLCGFISRVGYAFAKSWQVIIPLRILDRAGKIRDAPRDAIIADEAKKHERGGHFGILKMMDALGGVFGIIACIILFKYLGYKNLFLLAAVPSLISVLLVLLFIKEGEHSKNGKKSEWLSFREMSRDLKMFLGISALFALASFSYSFLLVYAQRFGFSQAQIPVLYLIFVLVASIFSIPFGRLADRIGRKPVLMISFLLWGIVCWIFLVLKNYPSAIILSFIIYGMHRGAIEPVQRTFISELSPAEKRASSLGLLQLTVGMCALPSSLLTGLLWDRVGMFFPLTISLGITIGAILLLTYVKETESQLPVKA